MAKTALITGVTGQDGSYLSEFLLEKGYEVHGIIRRSSVDYRERIAHLENNLHFHLHYGDLGDSMSMMQVISKVRPDEIYNLAAQSHVQVSFDVPEFTADVDAIGVLRVLEAVRLCGLKDTCRIYQASTSELSARWRRFRSARQPRSIPTARMPSRSSTATGSSRNTGKPTACSLSTASCSITSLSVAVKIS